MAAGVHLGHTVDVWHKNMLPFIYGRRAGIHVLNLEHTLVYLRRAMNVVRKVAARGGVILFVGQRPFLQDILSTAARSSGQYYVHGQWLQGSLINHTRTLRSLASGGDGGSGSRGGATILQPDLVVVLDVNECGECLKEVTRVGIPSIGLVDTDCNPDLVTYAIPGNDDAVGSVELIASLLAQAARDGRSDRERVQTMLQQSTSRGFPNNNNNNNKRRR